jgi:hypothetical protein
VHSRGNVRRCVCLLLAGLGACYQPGYRDCATTCVVDDDCAPGQVCGPDRWCAGPAMAGKCGRHDGKPDGGDEHDAASGSPDGALENGTLHLIVEGKGRIEADLAWITCEGTSPEEPAECSFDVELGTSLILTAVEIHHHWTFEGWAHDGCVSDGPACALEVEAPVIVTARFARD